jgi:hypothetical protein
MDETSYNHSRLLRDFVIAYMIQTTPPATFVFQNSAASRCPRFLPYIDPFSGKFNVRKRSVSFY